MAIEAERVEFADELLGVLGFCYLNSQQGSVSDFQGAPDFCADSLQKHHLPVVQLHKEQEAVQLHSSAGGPPRDQAADQRRMAAMAGGPAEQEAPEPRRGQDPGGGPATHPAPPLRSRGLEGHRGGRALRRAVMQRDRAEAGPRPCPVAGPLLAAVGRLAPGREEDSLAPAQLGRHAAAAAQGAIQAARRHEHVPQVRGPDCGACPRPAAATAQGDDAALQHRRLRP